MPGICAFCDTSGASMACSVCKRVYYCNKSCQKSDWRRHRGRCRAAVPVGQTAETGVDHTEQAQDRQILKRQAALPSLSDVYKLWRKPVVCLRRDLPPLHHACLWAILHHGGRHVPGKDLLLVRAGLEAGVDPNAGFVLYQQDRAAAAEAKQLISRAASLDDAVKLSVTPDQNVFPSLVCMAIMGADKRLLDTIHRHSKVPIDPNAVCMTHFDSPMSFGSPLHSALDMANDKLQAVEMALELGCSANAPCAFYDPQWKGDWHVTPVLQRIYGIDIASKSDQAEAILRSLKQAGADLNAATAAGQPFLHGIIGQAMTTFSTASQPFEQLLRMVLELGADPNLPSAAPSTMMSPVDVAVHHAMLELEPEHLGAPPSPLAAPKVQLALRLLQILKDAGADMRPESNTMHQPSRSLLSYDRQNIAMNYLREAVQADCVPLVQWILANSGGDVNFRLDNKCATYLFAAAYSGAVKVAKLLLEAGADPTIINCHGHTAARAACATMVLLTHMPPRRLANWQHVVNLLRPAEAEWAARHGTPAAGDGLAASGRT